MALITCKNVGYHYDARHGIRDVNFTLEAGDYLCIVGENGSGKSTLMKCLLGLLKPEGELRYEGVKPREIGYLPQGSAVRADFPASVTEVTLSGCLSRHGLLPFYSRRDRETAQTHLASMGLSELRRKPCCELSKGQQQRVMLARALCAAKRLLLLDEPVTGLDPIGASNMYALLQELNREGMTILMISHDIRSALTYGNKILHMASAPLFFGSTQSYLKTQLAHTMLEGGDVC
ncbi:MAG: metal ABC transporter ATP-binding protein [Oscillospiraceae bacterium]|nr:metal ABC transporter ATP-binding protein [Oscillospiraceae bacterium]